MADFDTAVESEVQLLDMRCRCMFHCLPSVQLCSSSSSKPLVTLEPSHITLPELNTTSVLLLSLASLLTQRLHGYETVNAQINKIKAKQNLLKHLISYP